MFEYPKKLDKVFDKLKKYNIKPIFVGGFVRDSFLNIKSKDIDIELYNANSFEQIQQILQEFGNSNIIGKSFGVIKLTLDEIEIDFSLPRLDNKVSSGHKGFEVSTFKNLDFKTASSRRDFSINAIGYDIYKKCFLDYYNGREDLKDKKLRFINATSFKEDPLRVLRAVQFCSRFGFSMDFELFSTCRDMVDKKLLNELAKERIYKEIKKIFLKSKKPSIGLKLLEDLDIKLFEIDDKKLKSVDNFAEIKIEDNKKNISIFLAILYNNSNINLEKLTNSNSIETNIKNLLHVGDYFQNKSKTISYNIAKHIDLEMLALYLKALHVEGKIINNLKNIRPDTHGKDLIKKGIKPSKEFSNILQGIYDKYLLSISITV